MSQESNIVSQFTYLGMQTLGSGDIVATVQKYLGKTKTVAKQSIGKDGGQNTVSMGLVPVAATVMAA